MRKQAQNTEVRDYIEKNFREGFVRNIDDFLSMDLEEYRRFVRRGENGEKEIQQVVPEKPFPERAPTFDPNDFEVALDRLGVRSFDLVETYAHELHKAPEVTTIPGRHCREEMCEHLGIGQKELIN